VRSKLKRVGLEVAIVILGLLAIRAYQTRNHVEGRVPEVAVRTLTGQTLTLGTPTKEPMVIHFWATWCGVCRAQEGSIDDLASTGRLITVASRSGSPAEVAAAMRQRGLSFPVVDDSAGTLATKFGVRAFPTTFFVDRSGVITTSEVGYTTYLGLRARLWLAGM